MEIERKFTLKSLPDNLESYPSHHIEQVYLNYNPVVRARKPGFKEGFPTPPADYSLTIELDVFDAPFAPLIMAEVEFGSKEAAEAFVPPAWFDKDVTYCKEYHNSYLALELHHAPENS